MKRTYGKIGAVAAVAWLLVTVWPVAAAFAQAGVTYFDSPTVTVTTQSIPTACTGSSCYALSCAPYDAASIDVDWSAAPSAPAGTLWSGPSITGLLGGSRTNVTGVNGSGSFNVSDPSGAVEYFGILDASSNLLSNTVSCGTKPPPAGDAPSLLEAFAISPTRIYLNWKDNSTSTAASVFKLQRFQVTPAAPKTLSAAENQTQDAVNLSWTNNAPVNAAPFSAVIERSTSMDPSMRFVSGQISGNDPSLVTLPLTQRDQTGLSATDVTNLVAGTTYYYRIQNCSPITVGNFYTDSSKIIGGYVDKPKPYACSPYVAASAGVTWTPLPSAPTIISPLLMGLTTSTISWQPADGATYYQIQRSVDNATWTAINANIGDQYYKGAKADFEYPDSGLQPGTVYYYQVASCNTDACYSPQWSASVSGQTQTVAVGQKPSPNDNLAVNISSPVRGNSLANLTSAVAGFISGLFNRLGRAISSLTAAVPTAAGQTAPNINYDALFNAGFSTQVTTPVYEDTGLQPSTVYLYRVGLVRSNGGNTLTDWAKDMVAGITLPSGASGGNGNTVPICTAYGYCDHNHIAGYTYLFSSPLQSSEYQCAVNADCRDVGRASQQTQEQ